MFCLAACSRTFTRTPSLTRSLTPSRSKSKSRTRTETPSPTSSSSSSPSASSSPSSSPSQSATTSASMSASSSRSLTSTSSVSPTPSVSPRYVPVVGVGRSSTLSLPTMLLDARCLRWSLRGGWFPFIFWPAPLSLLRHRDPPIAAVPPSYWHFQITAAPSNAPSNSPLNPPAPISLQPLSERHGQ